ncbi:MAG: Replication-relaxation [Acidobacteriota bacterium]|jgi:hypothetical protein|nr:Replication-relaxation [Acidobacteriota bacterium]
MHDPRAAQKLSARDIAVLVFVAMAREVAQYQIHALFFGGKSEVVVSRCVRRLLGLGLIAVYRWHKVGINRMRLTTHGAEYLREYRHAPDAEIHVAQRPVPDKDVAHSLWIVDLLVLFRLFAPEAHALPCWQIRRKLKASGGMNVPDVLALPQTGGMLVAVEVDRATERLRVLVDKLKALDATLATLAADAEATVLVLTIGERRVQAIEKAVEGASFRAHIVVAALPSEPGRPGLASLAERVFKRTV